MKKLVSSALFLAVICVADFNDQQWLYRFPISINTGSSVSEMTVTPEIYRHSSSQLTDLRIIRDESSEVPYSVKTLTGNIQQDDEAVLILNKSWTKGTGVQAVLDLKGHQEHNRLRIGTSEQNFKQAVIVETSDDAHEWSMVLSDGVIFDISRPEAHVSDMAVSYPTSTRRYVRVTIPGWTDAASLESAWLAEYKESAATRDIIAKLKPAVTEHPELQSTDVLFDLGFAGQPCDRLVLQVAPGVFSRMVEVSTSNTLKSWSGGSGVYISRTSKEEQLTLNFPESWQRYIKLTIFNADSAPIVVQSATASVTRRIIRFPSAAAGKYWLYLDNASARLPSYDFARVDDQDATAGVASVGAAESNPAIRPPVTPYSERKPWVLNIILGIAVVVMAFVTYRFAKKATSPAP